jgi:hypothetical protein
MEVSIAYILGAEPLLLKHVSDGLAEQCFNHRVHIVVAILRARRLQGFAGNNHKRKAERAAFASKCESFLPLRRSSQELLALFRHQ